MRSAEETRQSVAAAYTSAVERPLPAAASCCGTSSSCAPVEQKGVAVKSAGYDVNELAELPADAVVNSFGCGNPLAFSEVREGDVVLDLGSGAGIDLLIAAKKVGPTGRVIGIDMTDAMIERARANIRAAGAANIQVRKGVIEDLPVDSHSVDWVISNCVINLSPEKDRVFAEIARVLKPGGRISISDIVVDDLPDEVRAIESLYNSCIGGAISEEDYLSGLRAAGITDAAVADRFIYDRGALAAILASECTDEGCGCGAGLSDGVVQRLVASLGGRVASVRVTGRNTR